MNTVNIEKWICSCANRNSLPFLPQGWLTAGRRIWGLGHDAMERNTKEGKGDCEWTKVSEEIHH